MNCTLLQYFSGQIDPLSNTINSNNDGADRVGENDNGIAIWYD